MEYHCGRSNSCTVFRASGCTVQGNRLPDLRTPIEAFQFTVRKQARIGLAAGTAFDELAPTIAVTSLA
jgi:hypothetical protein